MSPPRSARGAKPKKGPAPARGGGRTPGGVFVQSPRSDVYVTMLGVALAAILIGCLLLVLVLNRYEFKTKVSTLTPAPPTSLLVLSENPENSFTVHL